MKLLLDGKQRSIYFLKDNTAYYKSGGSKTDITHMFKKNRGGLKKKYSNLLIENDNNILNKNNRKLILGGTLRIDPFVDIEIKNNNIRCFYKNMHQIFLLAKIQIDVGLLTVNKTSFIELISKIAGLYTTSKIAGLYPTSKIDIITYNEISSKLDKINSKLESDLKAECSLLTSYVQDFLKR